jgi:hypothetical protein
MTTSLIGQVCTSRGLIQQYDLAGDADAWSLPAVAYERAQRRVPILVQHDETWPVGEVAYYERSKADGLMMVGTIRDDLTDLLDDDDWHLSPEIESRRCGPFEYGHGKINEISLVRRTASIGTRPVRYARHDTVGGGGAPRGLPLRWYDIWDRAHEQMHSDRYTHRRDDSLRIHDIDPLDLVDEVLCDPEVAARVKAEAETIKQRAAVTTPPPPKPDVPRVRYKGVWLDEQRSARIEELLAFGYV